MSKHIYMSVGMKNEAGFYVDRFGAMTNVMNYRGVADNNADIPSFTKKMAAKGQVVVVSDTPLPNYSLSEHDGVQFVISYPACFNDQMATLFPAG